MKRRILLIGLDGATFTIIKPLIEREELPVFKMLLENGVHCDLESTIPPHTCPAWTSMVTGMNPGKHGIFDVTTKIDIEKKSMSFVNSRCRRSKAVWNLFDEAGLRSIIVNVPVTYPPEEINGMMVSGMFTPSLNSNFTYPKSLKKELLKRGYIIDLGGVSYRTQKDKKALIDRISFITRRRAECSLYLMKKYDWNFFMVVFVGLDRLHHVFWNVLDPNNQLSCVKYRRIYNLIINYYKSLDKIIGEFINSIGGGVDVILSSDHGFRQVYKLFSTNTFFKEKGLLELRDTSWLRKIGLTENYLLRLARMIPKNFIERISKDIQRKVKLKIPNQFCGLFDIYIRKTLAYQYIYNSVKINREAKIKGISRLNYDKVREHIINLLSRERDSETGRPVFNRIYKKEEVYNGPFLDDGPDLILEPNSPFKSHLKITSQKIMSVSPTMDNSSLIWYGEHDMNGILIMFGPSVKKKININRARIVDIAPTLCYMLDVPISIDMDGKILFDGLKDHCGGI